MKLKDLSGQTFGRLTALNPAATSDQLARRKTLWKCVCDCGAVVCVIPDNLMAGKTKSCGCLRDESRRKTRKHGDARKEGGVAKEYDAWLNAKQRCFNSKRTQFANYGGRGITMCEQWKSSYEQFLNDMGRCPDGYSLDRINTNGNYEPKNCRWASLSEQANNTRKNVKLSFGGHLMSITQWGKHLGIDEATIRNRIKVGWSVEKALTAPVRGSRKAP